MLKDCFLGRKFWSNCSLSCICSGMNFTLPHKLLLFGPQFLVLIDLVPLMPDWYVSIGYKTFTLLLCPYKFYILQDLHFSLVFLFGCCRHLGFNHGKFLEVSGSSHLFISKLCFQKVVSGAVIYFFHMQAGEAATDFAPKPLKKAKLLPRALQCQFLLRFCPAWGRGKAALAPDR